jgi:hypothetical protein
LPANLKAQIMQSVVLISSQSQFSSGLSHCGFPRQALSPDQLEAADFINDDDPCDEISRDAPELGIIIRTDYSNEDAWNAFCLCLQDGEKEFADARNAAAVDETAAKGDTAPAASEPRNDSEDQEMDGDQEIDSNDDEPSRIFRIVNASSPQERALFTNISNLTALRLLTDVDIRPSPPLPTGSPRLKIPNRLIDYDGWQEIYSGKHLWIYDTKSNSDQCVRLISHSGEMYGTAT